MDHNINSQLWIMLENMTNGKFTVKFDINAIKNIYKLEITVLDTVIIMIDNNIRDKKSVLNLVKKYHNLIIALWTYTGSVKYQKELLNLKHKQQIIINHPSDEIETNKHYLFEITSEVILLDNINGKKQCEYIWSLINSIYKSHLINPRSTKLIEAIKKRFDSEKVYVINKLIDLTLIEKKPSLQTEKIWIDWKIY